MTNNVEYHPERTHPWLKNAIPQGSTVWHITRKTENGAWVRLFVIWDNQIEEITLPAARIIEIKYNEKYGMYRRGCGYCQGTDCVEQLSQCLFGNPSAFVAKKL